MDWVIAGLGNPGTKYAHTRHNVGYDTLDILAQQLGADKFKKGFLGEYAPCRLGGLRLLLLKPHTYMNLSGDSVWAALDYYRVPAEHLLVLVDDVDLSPGRIRVRGKGGAGTHNGLRDILQKVGENTFARVRIGIGAPPPYMDLADFVLSKFAKQEQPDIQDAMCRATQAAQTVLQEGVEAAQAQFNGK